MYIPTTYICCWDKSQTLVYCLLQPPTCTAVVTIPQMREEPPEAKRVKLSPTPQTLRPLVPSASQVLNTSEVTAVRQLITGKSPTGQDQKPKEVGASPDQRREEGP